MGLAIRAATLTVLRRRLLRLLLATLCAVVLTGMAVGGIFFTTAPEFISLVAEPFSLLLMPGLIVSLIVAGPHDYSPNIVILVSLGCYILFFYVALTWLASRRLLSSRVR